MTHACCLFDEHVTIFDVKTVFQRLSCSLKLQQVQKLLETTGLISGQTTR